MSTLNDYFQQAELALAAYAINLTAGVPRKGALTDAGMSDAQATQFAATYTVVAQYSDATGVSATVFADATGHTYLAIRGESRGQVLPFAPPQPLVPPPAIASTNNDGTSFMFSPFAGDISLCISVSFLLPCAGWQLFGLPWNNAIRSGRQSLSGRRHRCCRR